ncbi:glycine--tRNA ligase subunit beta [Carboxydochorda subterranea]|uniref:Glycine--tRNA ligase beta subunit n=1 Tax=Carboxydichorda subterranea TaxID=3109565 RepID=A0ABZ1C0P1_9FIRM|nr:glycine--tRNA ligase subunit beta [Limnochorda sp. L945t]WRP18642.1 glycine--tRNA ligase subunit beta [Limnochorda sp. L945t]
MKDLLVELGVEELPARFVEIGRRQLVEALKRSLEQARLGCAECRGYATPRRLAALARGVPERQSEQESLVRGPSQRVAFDAQGRPTQAALGFARAQGVRPEDLVVRSGPEGSYVYAVKREPARPAAEVLVELIPGVVRSISFPKSMRWTAGELRFSRPIRWMVCLLGEQELPVRLDGAVVAGRRTRGHRLAHPRPVLLSSPDDYERALEEAKVIADPERRRRMTLDEIRGAALRNGGAPVADEALVDEITNLVEYPVALTGRFDPRYLDLPREVLLTTMAAHQRYVALSDPAHPQRLLPMFVVVANGPHIDEALVREGNERVLAARLADARFFYDEDRKQPLESRLDGLKGVVFHERLGTLYERTERLVRLALSLGRRLGLDGDELRRVERAAWLSKTDLLTHMVVEFPELQGIMGREYARIGGEDPAVAQALADQYLPRGSGAELPATDAGAVLGLADRLDALAGFFGVGLAPTGSEDPFALRRHALGLVRITLARGWRWPLRETIAEAARAYPAGRLDKSPEQVGEDVRAFVLQRLRGLLAEQDLAPGVIDAALGAGADDLVDLAARARALGAAREAPYFADAAVAFQRAHNLARGRLVDGPLDGALLHEPAERVLAEAIDAILPAAHEAVRAGRYEEAVRQLARLRPAVDRFFDEVLVMAEDERLRRNRLQMLSRIVRAFGEVADFAALVS